MVYLTYEEYSGYGGTLDEFAYSRYEFKARQIIDSLTHGRISNDDPVRQAVKLAMVDLVNAIADDAGNNGREIQSMGNDGVSVAYTTAGSARARHAEIVCDYLENETTDEGVPILYAGVDV
jgi:hypothetical protein